jgi:hypothetical protein
MVRVAFLVASQAASVTKSHMQMCSECSMKIQKITLFYLALLILIGNLALVTGGDRKTGLFLVKLQKNSYSYFNLPLSRAEETNL